MTRMYELNGQSASVHSPRSLKLLLCYLYFLQGGVLSICSTLPYIYPELPSYSVMSLFAASTLPFSVKFLTSPFLEKYTSLRYGKKKFWIVTSQMLCSALLCICSFFTDQSQALIAAGLQLLCVFAISLQDIALDSLCIKELRSAPMSGLIQSVSQLVGVVFFSTTLLKLTSLEFATSIGLSHSISSVSEVLVTLAIALIIPTIGIHLFFQQSSLDGEEETSSTSICQVVRRYRIFFRLSAKHCRLCIVYLFAYQGLNFFNAGYDYELIKAGFSRNVLNTISNVSVLPNVLFICVFSAYLKRAGPLKSFMLAMSLRVVLALAILIWFPLQAWTVLSFSLAYDSLAASQFLSVMVLNNSFPLHAYTGMFLTMFASASNLGKEVPIHLNLIGRFGWRPCAWFGLAMQTIIVIMFPKLLKWVEKGQTSTEEDKELESMSEEAQSPTKNKPTSLTESTIEITEL